MIASYSAATPRPARRLLVSTASLALLASGCSNLVNTAPSSPIANSAAKMGGKVHGGNQPVSNATVKMYFAGQGNALGSPATLVASTLTSIDGTGSFSFTRLADGLPNTPGTTNTFSCPTGAGSPYVYLVARGGNTLNDGDPIKNNSAAVFLAPIGLCPSITASTFTYMSEAVTAATVAAVHQYMNVSTDDIGADSILAAYDGLTNAFNTVFNLVSLTNGQTLASVPLTGSVTGVTVTATPEQAKLNQVANILSACINNADSTATACQTLFTNAVAPTDSTTTSMPGKTFPTATDVLQAAYYIFTNPTTNVSALYNLSPATGAPYQPTLTAVPSDWSVGIQYAAAGNCGTGGGFINVPYDINIDGGGNVWIANGQTGNGTLSELGPNGAPLACASIPGGSRGGTIDATAPGPGNVPSRIWIGDSENNFIYRYDPVTKNTLAFPTTTPPFAVAADGAGNIYYTSQTSPSVWMIPGGATATAAVAPVEISTTVGATPGRILVDGKNAIWVSSAGNFLYQLTVVPTGTAGSLNGYLTTSVSTPTPSYGIAANSGTGGPNGIYFSIQAPGNALSQLTGTGTAYATAGGFPTTANAGGLNAPNAIALDGASNVWSTNAGLTGGQSSVSEFSAGGVSLSGTGGFLKDPAFFQNGRSIAVDEAGNVWIGRDGSQQVTEIVGAAVPVFQSFAQGLAAGRFQQKP